MIFPRYRLALCGAICLLPAMPVSAQTSTSASPNRPLSPAAGSAPAMRFDPTHLNKPLQPRAKPVPCIKGKTAQGKPCRMR